MTRWGCDLCLNFSCKKKFGGSCSAEKHFRERHPNLPNWQEHITRWGKRFFHGDGTSHDVPQAELETDDEGDAEDEDQDMEDAEPETALNGDSETINGHGTLLNAPIDDEPKKNSRSQTMTQPERSATSIPATQPTSFPLPVQLPAPPKPTQRPLHTQTQTRPRPPVYAQVQPYPPENYTPPTPSTTVNPERIDYPSIVSIGPMDRWVLNGRFGPPMQQLARRVLLPPANDTRSVEERRRDEDQYLRYFAKIMMREARDIGFPREEWPHP